MRDVNRTSSKPLNASIVYGKLRTRKSEGNTV